MGLVYLEDCCSAFGHKGIPHNHASTTEMVRSKLVADRERSCVQALGAVKGMSHVPAYSEQFKARPALVAFHTRLQEQLFSSDAPSPWKGTWPPKAGQ